MRIKKLTYISVAALALTVLAGCQTMPAPTETPGQTITPTGYSTSTVEITNSTGLDSGDTTMTQEKKIKPFDGTLPQADQEAFMKADSAKNPQLCESITVESYKKLCVEHASDKDAPPMQPAPSEGEQKCTKTEEKDGKTFCIIYEE